MTTARSTMAMSSWVMPEVMCPNPLNRLNGWVRWNTTAMPPTTSTTAEQMSAGSCTAPPRFCSARMHWVPKMPTAQDKYNGSSTVRGYPVKVYKATPENSPFGNPIPCGNDGTEIIYDSSDPRLKLWAIGAEGIHPDKFDA